MKNAPIIPLLSSSPKPVLEYIDLNLEVTFIDALVSAGFPSPALDYHEESLNLGNLLVSNPSATYTMRVNGNSMEDANLFDGDFIIIDRSVTPQDGLMAVCYLDGGFTVKTIRQIKNKLYLFSENLEYKPIEINEFNDLTFWGIVTWIVHKALIRRLGK
jgi:DNA polymerase V